ncbi:hypothetical protein CAPTEDRAFT_202000 [Capitella teleta]|uniref:Uncharacterized protein n=1 Tax=Capitella teleta TaxID=283909 RepID=R7TFA2_CAPTE|nr:hypothetical protein CAPTEDRAFT_202000 [Capitella teleta]|eukprot:ELT90226.1 hypothetical protein CAPTEDRAFT_202000 [Capitella teleta]
MPTVQPGDLMAGGPHQPLSQAADPFQQAVAAVKQARTNPKYGHLLDVRQNRLNMMTRARLPETHQTGAPMDIPVLTTAEAYRIHDQRQQVSAAAPQPHPQPMQMDANTGHVTVGRSSAADRGSVGASASSSAGFGPPPPIHSGEPVVVHDKPAPRDDPDFNVFLEKSIQNEPDDVFREVAFRIIDDCKLQVADPSNSDRMALHNPRTDKTVYMTASEFKQAVAFICNPKEPLVIDLPERGKTMELLQLINPKSYGRLYDYFFPPPPDGERSVAETDELEEKFRLKVALQSKLNFIRKRLAPLTSMPAAKTWLHTLTMGLLGKPSDAAPGSIPSVETVASAAPPTRRAECASLLHALWDGALIEWDSNGAIRDSRNKVTMPNTNIFNIINNLYTLGSAATTAHLSRYEPTGLTFFVDRIMKLAQENGDIPVEVLEAVKKAGTGAGRWTQRQCNGRSYNLVRMFSTFLSCLPMLGLAFGTIQHFLPIMLALNPMSWSWFAYLYDWMASVGVGNQATAYMVNTLHPIVEAASEYLPPGLTGPMEGAVVAYGHQIPVTVFNTGMSAIVGLASVIMGWAMLWLRQGM